MRKQIITEALTWLNTPYHHKARLKGIGVDCAMLVAGVAANLDLIDEACVADDYSTQWHLHNNEERLLQQLEFFGCKLSIEPQAGDIVTFKYGRVTSHLGILINTNQIIHARQDIGKVVINDLNEELIQRITHIFKFPGVK